MPRARRKFFDAVKLNPKDQTSIRIVAQINELFAIDAQARQEGLSQIDRHVLRLEKSKPLLEQIKVAIQAARGSALPQERSGQGLRLHADALDPAQSFPGISRVGTLQQPGRERDAPGSSWSEKLDTRRK
jgi:Transposase IS66 family